MTSEYRRHPAEDPDEFPAEGSGKIPTDQSVRIPADKRGEQLSWLDNGITNEENDELRSSVQLLLLLSRTEFSGELQHQISEAFESFRSWQLFASLAVRHGVAALVWQNISDLGLAARRHRPQPAPLAGHATLHHHRVPNQAVRRRRSRRAPSPLRASRRAAARLRTRGWPSVRKAGSAATPCPGQ